MLLSRMATAGSYEDGFDADVGAWDGGQVADGVLTLTDGTAVAALLPGLTDLTLDARVRLVEGDRVKLLGFELNYGDSSAAVLGEERLPLPAGHWVWAPDDEPVITPGDDHWDGGNTLHCEVVRDEASGTFFLYWTGEMKEGYAYRQIGVATSTDGETWTEYAGNPVLTIDYDRTTIDGIHVHMPTVVQSADQTFHMFYACYQNDVGNRLCHATSPDGFGWTPEGMAVDLGAEGAFDEGSLRMPDALIAGDGTWQMLYNGTDPEQHYGPTGLATSPDGWTWTKAGAITVDETRLQGGGMYAGPYGVEQWWNCDDVFCHSRGDGVDWATWTDTDGVVLEKGWQPWSDGYIQSPSPWLIDTTWHIWFNAYTYNETAWGPAHERIAHARSQGTPGAWAELHAEWDGAVLSFVVDGATLSTPMDAIDAVELFASGTAELDSIALAWTDPATGESGTPDSAAPDDTGAQDSSSASDLAATPVGSDGGDCGCTTGPARGAPGVIALVLLRRRR
jgi:hypothetical protein